MYAKTIKSVSFPKAWEKAVKFVRNSPEKLTFGGGKEVKHAVDSQCTVILDEHAIREALAHVVHPSDPFATPNKLKEYMVEYTDEYDASKFDYTYYNILKKGFELYNIDSYYGFNQIGALKVGLERQVEEKMSSNRNIAVLWNPITQFNSTKSQPCWNEVMVRLKEEGKVQVY